MPIWNYAFAMYLKLNLTRKQLWLSQLTETKSSVRWNKIKKRKRKSKVEWNEYNDAACQQAASATERPRNIHTKGPCISMAGKTTTEVNKLYLYISEDKSIAFLLRLHIQNHRLLLSLRDPSQHPSHQNPCCLQSKAHQVFLPLVIPTLFLQCTELVYLHLRPSSGRCLLPLLLLAGSSRTMGVFEFLESLFSAHETWNMKQV